jgi:arginine/lysine/ornithine decarboxylase
LTQSTTFAEQQGSKPGRLAREQTLAQAIKFHLDNEKVSFHTPGHKGRFKVPLFDSLETPFAIDLTELPGLDELSEASSVLEAMQSNIAEIFGASESYISVNGASAALSAAIMSCAHRGKKIILPRDVHRSALNAVILSGLEPVFYQPHFCTEWQIPFTIPIEVIERLLAETPDVAAVVLCSPNYSGLVSDISAVVKTCKSKSIVSIIDEAHGAHFSSSAAFPASALSFGGDLVVHSLHKTLCAPTQTGLLHVGKNALVEPKSIGSFLNIVQSSSPSYLLMAGIERALDGDLHSQNAAANAIQLCSRIRKFINSHPDYVALEGVVDPLHILFKHRVLSAEQLNCFLQQNGIFSETILGNGVLLLVGFGSLPSDIDYLIRCLENLETSAIASTPEETIPTSAHFAAPGKQLMNPRKAFFARSQMVDAAMAAGCISAENYAPCPPGWAVLLAGQEINSSIQSQISATRKVRVVSSPLEGDSDGSNTPS